jgi:hypothetical protein
MILPNCSGRKRYTEAKSPIFSFEDKQLFTHYGPDSNRHPENRIVVKDTGSLL